MPRDNARTESGRPKGPHRDVAFERARAQGVRIGARTRKQGRGFRTVRERHNGRPRAAVCNNASTSPEPLWLINCPVLFVDESLRTSRRTPYSVFRLN